MHRGNCRASCVSVEQLTKRTCRAGEKLQIRGSFRASLCSQTVMSSTGQLIPIIRDKSPLIAVVFFYCVEC